MPDDDTRQAVAAATTEAGRVEAALEWSPVDALVTKQHVAELTAHLCDALGLDRDEPPRLVGFPGESPALPDGWAAVVMSPDDPERVVAGWEDDGTFHLWGTVEQALRSAWSTVDHLAAQLRNAPPHARTRTEQTKGTGS